MRQACASKLRAGHAPPLACRCCGLKTSPTRTTRQANHDPPPPLPPIPPLAGVVCGRVSPLFGIQTMRLARATQAGGALSKLTDQGHTHTHIHARYVQTTTVTLNEGGAGAGVFLTCVFCHIYM